MNTTIQLRVGSKWNGMIAIREKYLVQANAEKADILIKYPEGRLLIPFAEINHYHTISEKKFRDNFSNEMHALVYYKVPRVGEIYGQKPKEDKPEEVINTIPENPQTTVFG
jgi:uncharacterized radical SAM superfamily Fe-S cluster-containing enzyme